MGSEYDRKFEEMKQYIPFLENMIRRLESTSGSSPNPRQAQLDKIKSLRVLLLDKKKRMKMENLLKCEQVLVNLYAKVEQRDGFSELKPTGENVDSRKTKEQPDLETVRNKLKTVTKMQSAETLPEIARASEIEEVCTPGSKEPALFQRRPNKPSKSPQEKPASKTDESKPQTKRGYTRVLVSPETSSKRWSNDTNDALFSRRSPRRHSPSHHRKERKRTSKDSKTRKSLTEKDFNITLNVPEESLNTFNSKDILSRIIHCSDSDVDIDTLRDLRNKILGELKQTGANGDISELILQSYGKKLSKSLDKKNKKSEIEEGELSDSESEAIESIYGNLVLVDKDYKNQSKSGDDKSNQRKIQICLVLNSEKDDETENDGKSIKKPEEIPELEMYNDSAIKKKDVVINPENSPKTTAVPKYRPSTTTPVPKDRSSTTTLVKDHASVTNPVSKARPSVSTPLPKESNVDVEQNLDPKPKVTSKTTSDVITIEDDERPTSQSPKKPEPSGDIIMTESPKPNLPNKDTQFTNKNETSTIENDGNDFMPTLKQLDEMDKNAEKVKFTANFYKPRDPEENEKREENVSKVTPDNKKDLASDKTSQQQSPSVSIDKTPKDITPKETDSLIKTDTPVKIPLLDEKTSPPKKTKEVSEIDILQALKNEILSETLPIPSPEPETPALHLPKITKVANAQGILPKKKISLEKYKEKSATTPPAQSIFTTRNKSDPRDSKLKQSIRLTEKECERFNFPVRLSIDDESSDDDLLRDDAPMSPKDIYSDLAPKSPDLEATVEALPVIIPVEPVNPPKPVTLQPDIDMRPLLAPQPVPPPSCFTVPVLSPLLPATTEVIFDKNRPPPLLDPRMRKESQPTKIESPNPFIPNPDLVPQPVTFPPVLLGPSMTPSYTPSYAPSMTPLVGTPNARSYEMTPTHQTFDVDEPTTHKHVYAPNFYENNDQDSGTRDIPIWESNKKSRDDRPDPWDDRNSRSTSMQRDNNSRFRYDKYRQSTNTDQYNADRREYSKPDSPLTPGPSFGWSDCPATPSNTLRQDAVPQTYSRLDCPPTPSHHFGRTDCPPTPSHSFGRADCPPTPSHSFGRAECPSTPSQSFGRAECPRTPSSSFGRNDATATSSYTMGRSDGVRSEGSNNPIFNKDPRLNRRFPESESSSRYDDNDRSYKNSRGYGRGNYYPPNSRYSSSSSRYYDREHSGRRSDKYYHGDHNERSYSHRDRHDYRDHHSTSKEYEDSRSYSRSRDKYNYKYERSYNEVGFRRHQREKSVGRTVQEERSMLSTVGRNDEQANNKLSVKPDAGRSFTIDTSINTSFQNFLDRKHIQVIDYSFDARRKRASSVGRSLNRENSISHSVHKSNQESPIPIDRFKRANSVGRNAPKPDNRSFQDLKADFEAFKSKIAWKNPTSSINKESSDKQHTRSRKDCFERNQASDRSKQPYSPRKNYRDPRMRRGLYDARDRSGSGSGDRRQSGIVYSSDNIAKGTTMGTGFGVKNYKIPKIKRPEPEETKTEVEQEDKTQVKVDKKETPDEKTKNEKNEKLDIKETPKKEEEPVKSEINVVHVASPSHKKSEKALKKDLDEVKTSDETEQKEEEIERRVTRSSKQKTIQSSDENVTLKTKKNKKAVIFDSDSEEEKVIPAIKEVKTASPKNSPKKSPKTSPKKVKQIVTSPAKTKVTPLTAEQVFFDPKFAIDDLFPDTMVADPVIDNINDIIAELDNDLDPTKSVNSADIEKLMDSIDASEDNSLADISDVIEKDLKETLNQSSANTIIESTEKDHNITKQDITETYIETSNTFKIDENNEASESAKSNNEDIVSTSEEHTICNESSKDVSMDESDANKDSQSIPDSTINKNDLCSNPDESVPDSTNQIQNEVSSDVTSTHDIETSSKETVKEASAPRSDASKLDTLGSLLSILQDKSKLKEILSMLGETSGETDKIKKKLELLSEIVSDDEDDNNVVNEEKSQTESVKPAEDTNKDAESTKNDTLIEEGEQKTDCTDTVAETIEETANNTETSDKDPKSDTNTTNESVDNVNKSNNEDTLVMSDMNADSAGDNDEDDQPLNKIKVVKKKITKRGKGKIKKMPLRKAKANTTPTKKPKGKSRELQKLHEDIKEMFMSDDILNANGIRMCRLAKFVDDKNENKKDESAAQDTGPVVVLEKFSNIATGNDTQESKVRKKKGPKPKTKPPVEKQKADAPEVTKATKKTKPTQKYKPGPKSKRQESDPYEFDSDSTAETNTTRDSDDNSESDTRSLASSRSFSSNELLTDIKKKPKRKRRGWQSGIIKPKNRKKKDQKDDSKDAPEPSLPIPCVPDFNCFTDKNYCFRKNVSSYGCRLCFYKGNDIVNHYKKQHPHTEIPLSRMDPDTALTSIRQCEEINFQAIIKMPSKRYVCIFCNKEFGACKLALESFFWHIVSNHTGEYKQTCSMCVTATRCPFNLDIPPPPKDVRGQLIGYICGKCNFTQISLENLKTHVIVRHNDEQTEVYTINLALMSNKMMKAMAKKLENAEQPRVLRSRRSAQNAIEGSDERSAVTEENSDHEDDDMDLPELDTPMSGPSRSKITFEADDQEPSDETTVKEEPEDTVDKIVENVDKIAENVDNIDENVYRVESNPLPSEPVEEPFVPIPVYETGPDRANINKIVDCAHFKLHSTDTGAKEYVCCINGVDNHYKTTLLISMRKHVQIKHADNWDGYCSVCKVIVTPQGVKATFKDCLAHYLDKHIDNFPVYEKPVETEAPVPEVLDTPRPVERVETPKPYIAVRPLADLIVPEQNKVNEDETEPQFPKIENVVSLGETVAPPAPSPVYPSTSEELPVIEKPFRYEEVQAEIMSKKYRVVLDQMMAKEVLVRVFKCAAYYCSFTTDSADEAMVHTSTHQRVGGEGAMRCAYCNFDCAGNAIDLVMHVFKAHSCCQFACGLCFYRAAASQSVGAHFTKAHSGKSLVVYRNKNATGPVTDNSQILSRELAVPFYMCNHGKGSCKFRTYIAAKLADHLKQKHSSESWHPCNLCQTVWPSPEDLIQHLKIHGLKMYQCTWCVYGASNEIELYSHVASAHPNQQPQAYVRVINKVACKDGGIQLRMLPLATLNKSNVSVKDVTPSAVRDNPTREAERSIELEKLISHTNSILAPDPPPLAPTLESLLTTSEDVTVKLKTEKNDPSIETVNEPPLSENVPVPDVICLDSDEESPEDYEDLPPEKPEPVVEKPESVVEKLKPVVEKPEPVVEKPEPVVEKPEPVVEKPEPVVEKPEPIVEKFQPIVETPSETVVEPVEERPRLRRRSANVAPTPPKAPTPTKAPRKTPTPKASAVRKVLAAPQTPTAPEPPTPPTALIEPILIDGTSSPQRVENKDILKCPFCFMTYKTSREFSSHLTVCPLRHSGEIKCPHTPCPMVMNQNCLFNHYKMHVSAKKKVTAECALCGGKFRNVSQTTMHLKREHKVTRVAWTVQIFLDGTESFTVGPRADDTPAPGPGPGPGPAPGPATNKYGIGDVEKLPLNPIFESLAYCELCEYSTKVRQNLIRHLHLHAESGAAPRTEPVNPVPHIASNEMHFDKMMNLASSSAGAAGRPDALPADAAARYPRYVEPRSRYTCGARGCDYLSLDEHMLRRHWAALHPAVTEFRCAHCPRDQRLDTQRPLSAARVVAHLKMHDAALYACSACKFYHNRRAAADKHALGAHRGAARVLVVREPAADAAPPAPAPAPAAPAAPTMDLKPWQCGQCPYKTMLRAEIVSHCSATHQSKMQYKCWYCPFRTSAMENVTKHQSNAHPGKPEDIFYYFYKEGAAGEALWAAQARRLAAEPVVKLEEKSPEKAAPEPPALPAVDLNIVKQEVEEAAADDAALSIDMLRMKYGEFCDPNGIKYMCSLCNVVTEQTSDAMKSHLFEELKYRRWVCGACPYKAYHKTGLVEHVASEHSRLYVEPTELPVDVNIEKWVSAFLEHQTNLIKSNRDNLAKQKIQIENTRVNSPKLTEPAKQINVTSNSELEQAFGPFGLPSNRQYSCPKCSYINTDEIEVRNHLENELTKIRWSCSNCTVKFQNYHEAQFHCKSVHVGQAARPTETVRDPTVRCAWVTAVINSQRQAMKTQNPDTITPQKDQQNNAENSLLVVRYAEAAHTEENSGREDAARKRQLSIDSDDEKSDEPPAKKIADGQCPYCSYESQYKYWLKEHVLKHFGLKSHNCSACDYNNTRKLVMAHIDKDHSATMAMPVPTPIPQGQPTTGVKRKAEPMPKKVCLICEKSMTIEETETHTHDRIKPEFGVRGDVVVKCCRCQALRSTMASFQEHSNACHPNESTNYAYFKLQVDSRGGWRCHYCGRTFRTKMDVKAHHLSLHKSSRLRFTVIPFYKGNDDLEAGTKRKMDEFEAGPVKRTARKSTTKLPDRTVAKKSTSKLPAFLDLDSDSDNEYSYYGTKPLPIDHFKDVSVSMPMCNTMVDIKIEKLNDIIKIDPKVVVTNMNK